MKLSRLLLTVLTSGLCLSVSAVPAKRGYFTVKQPDGTELRVKRIGDEHMHFMLTDDNKLITEEDGAYYFSTLDANGLTVNTRILATPADKRDGIDTSMLMTLDEQSLPSLRAARAASRPSRAIAQSGLGRFTSNFPRTGKIKSLVILVEYKDIKFTLSNPYSYFNNMLNQEGFSEYGGTGSARDYFLFNSNNQFDPTFDVFGPYTLKNNRSYYGGNDDYTKEDKLPEEMVVEACKGLASQINFADYDLDNDGYVDNVFVIYAGTGEASGGPANSVWPHAWDLSSAGKAFKLNGKTINSYGCTNEWIDNRPDGVGTFVHEFSHVMGLPDLYATDYSSAVTPGEWSVLDYGPYNNDGCTPPNYSIFERNAMGWCEPIVLDGPESVTLHDITLTNEGCIIPTTKTNEFFLLENRQQTGWDTYLPGHGMLIWHIDFNQTVWDSNEVNNTASHMYVELEKADGTSNANRISGWSFPGTSGNTSFTNTTKPSMKTWNGTNIDMPITNIAEKNSVITFDAAGGKNPVDTPVLNKPTINGNNVTVTWTSVEGATDYIVTAVARTGSETIVENYNSKTLPAGWTKDSGIGTYTTTGNYKTNGTSLKFSKTGQSVTTTEYNADVTAISFWMKGQNSEGSKLTINGKINGSWTLIQELSVGKTEQTAKDITIESLPAGIKAVQFVYTKSAGNLALDDITITSGGGITTVIPGYENKSTGGKTTCVIDLGAASRATADDDITYNVTVTATDGEHMSKAAAISFKASDLDSSGIDNVAADNDTNLPVEYFNMQGIKVTNPSSGNIYIRRQGNTTTKVRF